MPSTTVLRPPAPVRGREWSHHQPWLSTVLRLGLGVVALAAGLPKVADLPASVRSVRAYELLPEAMAQLVGYGLPVLEVLLGLLLVLGLFTRWSALAFGALMILFTAAIISAWARGLSIDCGCFSPGGAVEPDQTAYPQEIARDLALLAVAVVLTRWPRSRYSLDGALDLH